MNKLYFLLVIIFAISTQAINPALNELNGSIKRLTKRIEAEKFNLPLECHNELEDLSSIKLDEIPKSGLHFLLKKEHRMLDTIARLLAFELGFSYPSISLTWHKNQYNETALITSFNGDDYLNSPSKKELVTALKSIKIHSKNISQNHSVLELKSQIKEKVLKLKEILSKYKKGSRREFDGYKTSYYEIRNEIDLIKLSLSIRSSDAKYEAKIAQFFKNINFDSVKILYNKHRVHSELNIINYTLKNNVVFGYIKDSLGNKVFYNYIGNSMNTCAKCSKLINGGIGIIGINNLTNKNNIAIFTRGNNKYCFRGSYRIPSWSIRINNKSPDDIRKCLNNLPMTISGKLGEKFSSINHELSESDD